MMNNASFKGRIRVVLWLLLASLSVLYFTISIYFSDHFFFNTVINNVDVSLKSYDEIADLFRDYAWRYELDLAGRHGYSESIKGQEIGLHYNEKNSIDCVQKKQKPLLWIMSLRKESSYDIGDVLDYDRQDLNRRLEGLRCLNERVVQPKNVSFGYSNGSYKTISEIYGNKIHRDRLKQGIMGSVLAGKGEFDLEKNDCYEDPKYTLHSKKTNETRDRLNRMVQSKIIYGFGSRSEVVDGKLIHKWLRVDSNLDIIIDEQGIKAYVKELAKTYNTVGITRDFKSSTGKTVDVSGGLYGWKIDCFEEKQILIQEIQSGRTIEREPIYAQSAHSREKDDIGNTYVEINRTRQHLWFYKNGDLVTHGPIVTGNASRGYDTDLGTYMLNYKIRDATLRGDHYETKVKYWMPFYGNIGIHDASWRHSFGGEIYKHNGSHGCVNVPEHLAKTLYDNIESGMPIVCYEEE